MMWIDIHLQYSSTVVGPGPAVLQSDYKKAIVVIEIYHCHLRSPIPSIQGDYVSTQCYLKPYSL